MKLVKFQRFDGAEIWVNAELVQCISGADMGSWIHYGPQDADRVVGTPDEVAAELQYFAAQAVGQ